MDWTDDPNHLFSGIAEKLKRADQTIGNLHTEILAFFKKSKYPVLPNPNDERWQEAVDYHSKLPIPTRFSVLAGEIVHHLRSSLDHVVWIFSNEDTRRRHENSIAFPVLCDPADKNELKRFNKQIQGVDDLDVRKIITDLQPFKRAPDTANDPLLIIHNMDRFDKHRELVIVSACANLTFPSSVSPEMVAKIMAYKEGEPLSTDDVVAVERTVKQDAEVFPQVSFRKFGKRDTKFVIPALAELQTSVVEAVDLFASKV